MDFDTAFDRLIGHEGGLVALHHRSHDKSFSDQKRGRRSVARGVSAGGSHLRSPYRKRSSIRLQCAKLRASGMRQRSLQWALPEGPEGRRHGCAATRAEAAGPLFRLQCRVLHEGRMGDVQDALPSRAVQRHQGCCHRSHGRRVRALRRCVPTSSVRLPSSRRQERRSKLDAREQIGSGNCRRARQMQPVVRELPSHGARR